MGHGAYPYETNKTGLFFEFFSEGPKGKIKKVVRFTLYRSKARLPFYNLEFGDWNENEKKIDHFSVTNNEDKEKVLMTVAKIVVVFTDQFSDLPIHIEGSTAVRTRLYQMGINKYWLEINRMYNVYGFDKFRGWEDFKRNKNYSAFLIHQKRNNFITNTY